MKQEPVRAVLGIAFVLLTTFTSLARAAEIKADWKDVGEGLAAGTLTVALSDGRTAVINALRFDPNKYRLDVIYVPDILERIAASLFQIPRADVVKSQSGTTVASPTLDAVSEAIAPIAAINGGYRQGSYTYVLPAGLLYVDRTMIYPLNKKSKSQSGVLCVLETGVQIYWRAEIDIESCVDAVQSGPLIVDPGGKIGIGPDEPKTRPPFRRSFVCLGTSGDIVLGTTTEIHLFHLAEVLAGQENQGGLGCERALNLSGDVDAGLIIRDADTGLAKRFGLTDAPIASALIVTANPFERQVTIEEEDPLVKEGKDLFGSLIGSAFKVIDNKELDANEKEARLIDIAFSTFAVDQISNFVLGKGRARLNEKEREEFKRLYAHWVIRKYLSDIAKRSKSIKDIKIARAGRLSNSGLELETDVILKDSPVVRVSWKFVRSDKLRIVDVSIEGISMIATQRSDFSRVLFEKGPDALLEFLRKDIGPLEPIK